MTKTPATAARPASRTRAEQETILRWDAEDQRVVLYTASPHVAAKWTKLGYTLTALGPASWTGVATKGSVTVRRAHRAPRRPGQKGQFQPRRTPAPTL